MAMRTQFHATVEQAMELVKRKRTAFNNALAVQEAVRTIHRF